MRRFHFPLEQALVYKARRERIAELRQLQALGEKNRCDAQVRICQRLIEETAAGLQSQLATAINMAAWFVTQKRIEYLDRQLKLAQEKVRQAEKALNQATTEYRQAAQEAEALRTLRQKQQEVFLEAQAKAEQTTLDDLSLVRWRNEQAEKAGGGMS